MAILWWKKQTGKTKLYCVREIVMTNWTPCIIQLSWPQVILVGLLPDTQCYFQCSASYMTKYTFSFCRPAHDVALTFLQFVIGCDKFPVLVSVPVNWTEVQQNTVQPTFLKSKMVEIIEVFRTAVNSNIHVQFWPVVAATALEITIQSWNLVKSIVKFPPVRLTNKPFTTQLRGLLYTLIAQEEKDQTDTNYETQLHKSLFQSDPHKKRWPWLK